MNDYLPRKDAALEDWTGNFLSIAGDNLAALGLTATDLNSISGDNLLFAGGLVNITTTKNAAKGAVKGKDAARKTLVHDIRYIVKRIQIHPGVSADLKAQLGINADNGERTSTPPVEPINVMAKAQATGINSLTWNRNGNIASTQFVVEAKKPADTAWTIVGQTTRSKFNHTGQTPGVTLWYRVVAARADKASQPSAVVMVYPAAS